MKIYSSALLIKQGCSHLHTMWLRAWQCKWIKWHLDIHLSEKSGTPNNRCVGRRPARVNLDSSKSFTRSSQTNVCVKFAMLFCCLGDIMLISVNVAITALLEFRRNQLMTNIWIKTRTSFEETFIHGTLNSFFTWLDPLCDITVIKSVMKTLIVISLVLVKYRGSMFCNNTS